MLTCCTDFDELVQGSKDNAEDALRKIPEIERQIREAEDTTARAVNNLADARRDAELAKSIAADAQDTAVMAADVSAPRCLHTSTVG